MEPLNSRDVQFSLNFINDGAGEFRIDEPLNFDALNFVLQQEDDRYGRDVSFAGGDFQLRFDSKSNQIDSQLPRLLQYNTNFGYESQVEFRITIYTVLYVIGLLDFQRAVTDGLTYFECSVIQESNEALLKRRSDIKVDMFSSADLDGNVIAPLSTQRMFLPGTTLSQQSTWTSTNEFTKVFTFDDDWNHINAITLNGIEDTLSFIVELNPDTEFLRYIEAQNNLFDVVLEISNFDLNQNAGNPVNTMLVYRIGLDFSTATEITLEDFGLGNYINFSNTYNLPDISIGETLWVYFTTAITLDPGVIITNADVIIDISVNATPISTVTNVIPIENVINQIVLSTTGMSTTFSADFQTAVLEEYVFNGLALRGFDPDNFYVSFDDVRSWFEEINADFQIEDNTTVFVGLYADFYTDFLIGSNTVAPNEEFKITYNPRYTVNKFSLKYDKFEDEKNTENNRALNSIHTESQWNLPNLQVENKKELEITFIRDFALIETVRRFNSLAANTESTKNDEDIFMVNVVDGAPSSQNNYNFNSFVSVDGAFVTFTNNNSFSFIASGITLGLLITFDADDGTFTATGNVVTLSQSIVVINDFGLSGIVNGNYIVNFDFTVFGLTARTNQGFATIVNDGADGEGFVNIVFSPKRNILNYWGAYLNTACSFNQTGIIRNTFFIGNGDLESDFTADGFGQLRESTEINVSDLNTRLLLPYIVETVILIEFTEFQDIVANLRNERGYLEIADNNGNVIEVYPQLLDYNWEQNALRIIGEQRI